MKKINKLLITSAMLLFAGSSIAEEVTSGAKPVVSDLTIKLSAFAHFQAGFRNQNHLAGSEKNVSANRDAFAFFNDTALCADIADKVNEFTYGAKIVLVPTAKRKGSPSYNGSHIYMEGEFGRVEAGSPFDAANRMNIDGSYVASATGGAWDKYAKTSTDYLKQNTRLAPSFATFGEFFLDSKLVSDIESRRYTTEPGRRVSYYTPKFEFAEGRTKTQLGFSYTPDSSNTGADNPDKNSTGFDKREISDTQYFRFDKSVKNALSGGINLEQNLSDGVDLKIGLSGEYGKAATAKEFNNTDKENPIAVYKLKDLRTYNLGVVLNTGNFSYAASYGTLGKSLTTPAFHKTGRKTDYYIGGAAYKQGPFSASVTYFRSNQYKNTVDSLIVGTDYLLAPGFKPYAEITEFLLKGRPEFFPNLPKKKTRGTVVLIGAKLSI